MRRLLGLALGLTWAAGARATDPPEVAPPPRSMAQVLDQVKKGVADAEALFRKAATSQRDNDPVAEKKVEELYRAFDRAQSAGFDRAVELAKVDPTSDVGFAALEWVLTTPRSFYLPPGKAAMELVLAHYSTNPKIGKIVSWVGYYPPRQSANEAAAMNLIRAVAEKNPDRTVRAQAVLALALDAKWAFAVAEFKKNPDAEKLATLAETQFENVLKDYGDAPRLIREKSGTIGDFAKAELFELRNLRIGKTVPEIEGEDVDGAKFKISDYRGKVVMLDFWGHW